MTAEVTLNLEGVPLKTTLRLALKQVRLDYVVEDGLLQIGNASTLVKGEPLRGIRAHRGSPSVASMTR
jgi:hypothetical protein